jgi:hypothetical protein
MYCLRQNVVENRFFESPKLVSPMIESQKNLIMLHVGKKRRIEVLKSVFQSVNMGMNEG